MIEPPEPGGTKEFEVPDREDIEVVRGPETTSVYVNGGHFIDEPTDWWDETQEKTDRDLAVLIFELVYERLDEDHVREALTEGES